MAGIQTLGYNSLTPIQAQTIPLIMQGKDVIGVGEPGAGKTAAFIIPILHHLCKGGQGSTRALILSPTAELAEQTSETIARLSNKTQLKNKAVYGDPNSAKQDKELRRGPDIIVGCPNSMIKYLLKGTINLSSLEILVIDEADRMSGLGYLPDIFNILMCIATKRQTLLFSATMPENIRRLSRQFLTKPVTVQIDPRYQEKPPSLTRKPALRTQKPAPQPAKPAKYINKTTFLKDIISKNKGDSILVFTRAVQNAGRVALQLKKEGYLVSPLKGSLSRFKKPALLGGLPGGPVIILVVKDPASRGIDVSKIFRTINYETPEGTVDNEHRVGRTGKVDKNGDAVTFVSSTSAVNMYVLEKLLETPLEPLTLKDIGDSG